MYGIFWLDYHVWNEEIKRKEKLFATLILSKDNEQKCAVELIVERFALKRTACNRMANFAHIVDFRLPKVRSLPPLLELIIYYRSLQDVYNRLQSIVKKASKDVF